MTPWWLNLISLVFGLAWGYAICWRQQEDENEDKNKAGKP